jgi:hypothetical protein
MSKKEFKATRSLRLHEHIRILLADKGKCMVVLDKSECKDKLNTLLESGFMNPCPKNLQTW